MQRSVLERFEALVLERVKRIRVGAPTDADTASVRWSAPRNCRVLGYIESGVQEGAADRRRQAAHKAISATASMSSRRFHRLP